MSDHLLYAQAALYFGVLTSISPCPLATNIAAVSYVGRKVGNPLSVIAAGLLYTLGRCLLYLALAVLIVGTAGSIPAISRWLQQSMHLVLGPIFLVLGIFLVGLVTTSIGGASLSEGMQKRIDALGIWGSLPLGVLFAVSFCPTSAAWFFGLLAIMMGTEARAVTASLGQVGLVLPETPPAGHLVVMPLVYGLGTALPVLLVTFILAFSAQYVGRTYNILSKIEWVARQVTGWIFVCLGVVFIFKFVFEVPGH